MIFSKYAVGKFHSRQRQRGLSLIEVSISTLLTAVVLVGALKMVGGVLQSRQIQLATSKGPILARQLMTEVIQAAYEDPEQPSGTKGLDTGETNTNRADLDDVDDYDSWSAAPPQTKLGLTLPDCDGWQRNVVIDYVVPNLPSTVIGFDGGVKRITVTVTAPNGEQTQLIALRSKLGTLEHHPNTQTKLISWVGGKLQIGGDALPATSGTNLVNHARDQ